jgi:hypothetical protein
MDAAQHAIPLGYSLVTPLVPPTAREWTSAKILEGQPKDTLCIMHASFGAQQRMQS